MHTTYDVKFWKTSVYEGKTKTTYTVRWVVAGEEWRKPFSKAGLADSFRAGLVSAASKGEAFSVSTGLPVSHMSQAMRREVVRLRGPVRRPDLGADVR